jgi:hypothetical protein
VRRAAPPAVVLVVALVLPGMGQVLNNQPRRGLVMVFYMILLGTLTSMVAAPDASWMGRLAGGLFVYAMSIMDAYRTAALHRRLTTSRSAICPQP